MYRNYITQHRLNKIGFSVSDIGTQRTQNTTDTYSHAIWHCSPVFGLQSLKLSSILVCRIPLSPHLCLPSDKTSISFPTKHAKPTLSTLAIAKKIILINWKNKHLALTVGWISLSMASSLDRKGWHTLLKWGLRTH